MLKNTVSKIANFVAVAAVIVLPMTNVAHATDDGLGGASAAISGMGTTALAGIAVVVTAGIGLKVIPMGIRFLGRVWNAISK